MSGIASIRLAPIHTKTVLTRTENHNERKEGDKTGKHIDLDRIKDDKVLIGNQNDNFYKIAVEKITGQSFTDEEWERKESKFTKNNLHFANGRKVRTDAIIAVEAIMHYPGEMVTDENENRHPKDADEFERWQKNSVEYLKKKFGEENVISAILHMDESTPHIHAVIVPTYINERNEVSLNFSKYISGKKDCAILQTEYAKATGYERGNSLEKANHQNVKHARAILTKSVGAELPPVEKKETAEEYRKRVNPEYEKVRVQRDVAVAKNDKHSRLRENTKKQEEKLEQQNQEIERQRQQIIQLQNEIERRKQKETYEKLGMELSDNTEEEKRIYNSLKESYIMLGMKKYKEYSFGMIDKDNDGIDDRDEMNFDEMEIRDK